MRKTTAAIVAAAALAAAFTPVAADAEIKTSNKPQVSLQDLYEQARLLFHKGEIEKSQKLFAHIAKYRPDHKPTRRYLAQIRVALAERPGNPELEKKLNSINLSEVDINGVPIADALQYLRHRTKKATEDGFVPNILLQGLSEQQKAKPITIQLENVPLAYALKSVGDAAGINFRYEKHAIVGSPKPTTAGAAADAAAARR